MGVIVGRVGRNAEDSGTVRGAAALPPALAVPSPPPPPRGYDDARG
jgi:hypothetical protein